MNAMAQANPLGGEVRELLDVESLGGARKSTLNTADDEISSAEGTYEVDRELFGLGMWKVRDVYNLDHPASGNAEALTSLRETLSSARQVAQGVFGSGTTVAAVGVGHGGLLDVLDIVQTMEVAKPKGKKLKGEVQMSAAARRRRLRPPSELYPDLDLERIQARVGELHETASTSEAVSLVLGRSVQIVRQAE